MRTKLLEYLSIKEVFLIIGSSKWHFLLANIALPALLQTQKIWLETLQEKLNLSGIARMMVRKIRLHPSLGYFKLS